MSGISHHELSRHRKNYVADPVAKARAIEARVMEKREENRRKFPTAARLMDQFKQFSPMLMMAEENGFHVEHKNYRNLK